MRDINNIDELIVQYLTGDIIASDKQVLNEWVKNSDENKTYLSEMEQVWHKSDGLKAFREVDVEADFEAFKSKVGLGTQKRIVAFDFSIVKRIAAVMIPAIMLLGAYSLYNTTPGFGKWSAFKTSNEVNSIVLADNSEVALNQNSRLVYEKNFNNQERLLKLSGEAYFDVAKNPSKPFIVKVGDAQVKVLGTEFNLEESKENGTVTLAVTEGKVLFTGPSNEEIVVAGEKAVLKNGSIVKSTMTSDNLLAWRTGVISFEQASLSEVVETIVDHFSEVSKVENNASSTSRVITTRFSNPSLDDVLVELRIHFEKKFEIHDNKLIISD